MSISFDPSLYTYGDSNTTKDKNAAYKISDAANGLSSESTEEELKSVLKDFESYFLEQIIKEMKETFTFKSEEDSTASQYTDFFMDTAIEEIADKILEEDGQSLTQQLYEQMKRNYNIE